MLQRKLIVGGERYNGPLKLKELAEMWDDKEYSQYLPKDFPSQNLILDPRVQTLAGERNEYEFESWDELHKALNEHWKNNDTSKVPDTMILGRKWAKAPALPTPKPCMVPSLDQMLPQELPPMGKVTTVATWPPPKPTTPKTAPENEGLFRGAWENCGQTAEKLIGRINDTGGQLQLVLNKEFKGMHAAYQLGQYLLAPVSRLSLLNVIIPRVHEFTLEKRPDGTQVLHQGYLSQYNALWWAGLDEDLAQHNLTQGQLSEARDVIGKGQPFGLEELRKLVKQIGDFLLTDVYGNPQSAEKWKQMPFGPKDMGVSGAQRRDEFHEDHIIIQLKIFVVQNEVQVRQNLNGQQDSWLTTLVLQEAKEKWDEIVKAKGGKK